MVDPDVSVLYLPGLTFGPITLGGWCMNVAWVVFIAVSMIFFQDPLILQKEQEKKKPKDSSADAR